MRTAVGCRPRVGEWGTDSQGRCSLRSGRKQRARGFIGRSPACRDHSGAWASGVGKLVWTGLAAWTDHRPPQWCWSFTGSRLRLLPVHTAPACRKSPHTGLLCSGLPGRPLTPRGGLAPSEDSSCPPTSGGSSFSLGLNTAPGPRASRAFRPVSVRAPLVLGPQEVQLHQHPQPAWARRSQAPKFSGLCLFLVVRTDVHSQRCGDFWCWDRYRAGTCLNDDEGHFYEASSHAHFPQWSSKSLKTGLKWRECKSRSKKAAQ